MKVVTNNFLGKLELIHTLYYQKLLNQLSSMPITQVLYVYLYI